MSDDMWRDEEGRKRAPLFGDDEPTTQSETFPDESPDPPRAGRDQRESSEGDSDGLSFGTGDTGPLPHWTEPPTGEMPRLEGRPPSDDDPPLDDELDVWSSFTSESPVWRDDVPADPSGEVSVHTTGQHDLGSGQVPNVEAREPSRITIGTDPSGMPRRPTAPTGRGRGRGRATAGSTPSSRATAPVKSGRDLPMAVGVGLAIAVAFIAALMWRPVAVLAIIVAVVGLGAVEFYDKVSEKGYRPAVIPGILACISAPLAAYWLGAVTLPLVITFAFIATAGGFIGARSVEAGPMPNVSITMLGVIWIGLMGSFAALILAFSTGPGSPNFGTDTLFLLALGVVANDVGAYFVGSAAGRTPLRQWISPSKSVEGLIGGTLFTIVVLVVVGITDSSETWSNTSHLLVLALVISVFAPMGDLVESMFKRNLDVKDFGSLVKGHGGVLDRFDGFLLTLPIVYYVTLVLEPWLG
jgi:phosphatidate cytidylyltransferase